MRAKRGWWGWGVTAFVGCFCSGSRGVARAEQGPFPMQLWCRAQPGLKPTHLSPGSAPSLLCTHMQSSIWRSPSCFINK